MKFPSALFFSWILTIQYTAEGQLSALTLVHDGGQSFDVVDDVTTITGEPFKVIILACPIKEKESKGESEKMAETLFKRSLIVMQIHRTKSEIKNDKICKTKIQPGIWYHITENMFVFGYRVYFGNEHIKLITDLLGDVNQESQPHPISGYNDRLKNTKNEPNIYWYVVTEINIFPNKALIAHHRIDTHNYKQKTYLEKCENYNFGLSLLEDKSISNIYEREFQNSILEEFKKPTPSEIEADQMYLVEQQLTPIDDFDSQSEREATCSIINLSPMWSTIAHGWWKQVEMIIKRIAHIKPIIVTSGTYGILRLPNTMHPNHRKFVLLKDTVVPEVYWKLVRYYEENEDKTRKSRQGMLVFTYNYFSNSVPHRPLCVENNCKILGWDGFDNENYNTGMTYCCSPKEDLLERLGLVGIPAFDNLIIETTNIPQDRRPKYLRRTNQFNYT